MGICNLVMVVVMVMAVVVVEQEKYADAKNMLLVARKGGVRKVDLDAEMYTSEQLPIRHDLRDINSIEYDTKYGYVYWSQSGENAGIYKARLDGKGREVVVNKSMESSKSLALDDKDRLLYWSDPLSDTIESVRLNGTDRKLLIKHPGFTTSISIINTQKYRYIYYTAVKDYSNWIMRATMQGKEIENVVADHEEICCLAIDSETECLYWGVPNQEVIKTSGLNPGDEPRTLYNGSVVSAMSILGDYLYWTDHRNNKVVRIDKNTGKNNEVILDELAGLVGLKAFVWKTPEKMPTIPIPIPTTPLLKSRGDDIVDKQPFEFQSNDEIKNSKTADDGGDSSTAIILVAVVGTIVDVAIAAAVLLLYLRSGGRAGPRPNM